MRRHDTRNILKSGVLWIRLPTRSRRQRQNLFFFYCLFRVADRRVWSCWAVMNPKIVTRWRRDRSHVCLSVVPSFFFFFSLLRPRSLSRSWFSFSPLVVYFSFVPLSTCSLLFLFFLTSHSIFIVLPPHSHPPSLSNAHSFLFIINTFSIFSLLYFFPFPFSSSFIIVFPLLVLPSNAPNLSYSSFFQFSDSFLTSRLLFSDQFPLSLLQHFTYFVFIHLLNSSLSPSILLSALCPSSFFYLPLASSFSFYFVPSVI